MSEQKNEASAEILFRCFLPRSSDSGSGLGFEDRRWPDLLEADRQDWGPGSEAALPEASGPSWGKIGMNFA